MLELGCAAGGNLIPMAEAFPQSEFVGIDLSARQVADGQRVLDELKLPNLTLRHASITEVADDYGKFDYVICHGVFSWVPRAVQDAILSVCARHLTPRGVGYVSYNTYPGWNFRGTIRDIMRYHASRFATPKDRARQARSFLDFMAESVRQDGGPYSILLRQELEAIRHQADHYLYHEHLEDVNDPLYFHEFVERAEATGLRYRGEARVGTMGTGSLSPDVAKVLKLLANDQIQTEQYLDFLRNRTFRETLLVPAAVSPSWSISPDRVWRLHIASGNRPADSTPVELNTEASASYKTLGGANISTTSPVLKAALRVLAEAWPRTLPFADLLEQTRSLLTGPTGEDELGTTLAHSLLTCYMGSDLIELQGCPIDCVGRPGERPLAAPSARLRAGLSTAVANRRHEVVRLNDLEQHLLPLLDGSRDRESLAAELARKAATGTLRITRNGRPVSDSAEIRVAMGDVLNATLEALGLRGLLVE